MFSALRRFAEKQSETYAALPKQPSIDGRSVKQILRVEGIIVLAVCSILQDGIRLCYDCWSTRFGLSVLDNSEGYSSRWVECNILVTGNSKMMVLSEQILDGFKRLTSSAPL